MIVLPVLLVALAPGDLDRHVYPFAPSLPCPPVVVDVSDSPESKAWADRAKALVESWYGKVTELLATGDKDPVTGKPSGKAFVSPKEIRLVFKKTADVPAYASGGTITVNGSWIAQRPDDLGMVVHELVHVVQQYPNSRTKPGWLVEGIADYIRWWRYEPELHAGSGRTTIDKEKAKYTDSYRTTAMWLAWCSRKYDMRLVPALDKALREGKDPIPRFAELTGKSPDGLWKEFVAAQ
jgi:hypothetical protein